MLRPALRHGGRLLAAVIVLLLIAAGSLAWRIGQGPLPLDRVRPAVERLIALQSPGGRATVQRASLVWFPGVRALGLRLEGVRLQDRRGRPVLVARRLEAAGALSSYLLLRPAVAHVAVEDFFAAVSVSPQGRYQLGYDASGAPRGGGGDLARLLSDLTGKVRIDRPASRLGEAEFDRGTVAFREVGGPIAWTGHIRRVAFSKTGGRLNAVADLGIGVGPTAARLAASGEGATGLGTASASVAFANFVPARILPAAGATRALAVWDAPIGGRATVAYAARTGFRSADVDLASDAGALRLGRQSSRLRGARLRAHYDPAAQRVLLDGLTVDSERNAFAFTGTARLRPERTRVPLQLLWTLTSAGGRADLAGDVEPAVFTGFAAQGRLIPARKRLEVDSATLRLPTGSVAARLAVTRPRSDRSAAVDLDGGVAGFVSEKEVLAFWPHRLAWQARDWVSQHVLQARASGLIAYLHLPSRPLGDQTALPQDAIHLAFDLDQGRVALGPGFAPIEDIHTRALIQGDHLLLDQGTARANGVGLSQAEVEINRFKGAGQRLTTSFHALGDARSMLQLVDGPGDHVLTKGGFAPARLTGQGDVQVSISRPMGAPGDPPLSAWDIRYGGELRQGVVTDAVLGLNLQAPLAKLEGTAAKLHVRGPAVIGPYRGAVDYTAAFPAHGKATSVALADGVIDAALARLGGPAARPMAVVGRFEMTGNTGRGLLRSTGFEGGVDWTSGPRARSVIHGSLNAEALRQAGLPVSKAMPARTPARLVLVRNGGGWNGQLDADVYSGAISFTPGPRSHIRYVAQLTPQESRRLGLGSDPVFQRVQPLLVDVSMSQKDGGGSYALGPYTGQVGWSEQANGQRVYRWRALLGEANLHMLGLPTDMRPRTPCMVEVDMTSNGGVWSGSADLAGSELRFSAQEAPGGRRQVTLNGPVRATTLEALGAAAPGELHGQAQMGASLSMGVHGLTGGQVSLDLTQAAFVAPDGVWSKAAGQPFLATATLVRRADGGFDVPHLAGGGSGAQIDGSASWRATGSALRLSNVKIAGVYDGSLQVEEGPSGVQAIAARARYLDARRVFARRQGAPGARAAATPLRHIDLQAGQVQVTDKLILRQVRVSGSWGAPAQRRLEMSAMANAGGAMSLSVFPDGEGSAISGRIENVSDAAQTLFDMAGFRGGEATVSGHLVADGADLDITMHDVRLTHAPLLAQVLTMGSLQGMANTLNGDGIYFSHVIAPVKLRGSKVYIGQARATGRALGLTTSGVIDMERRTIDLKGAVAPAYGLNGLMGKVPLVGALFVPHKGEGVFGVTYAARGGFDQPKLSVNPLSLAAPGFLRRMFEGKSETGPPPAGAAPASVRAGR